MSDSPAAVPDDASRFFDNYLICLAKASVPEKRRRWYVKRVEAFIRAQNGRKIKALSGQDIHRYLDVLGRQERLSGWQFARCIHAMRIPLFAFCGRCPLAQDRAAGCFLIAFHDAIGLAHAEDRLDDAVNSARAQRHRQHSLIPLSPHQA